MSLNLNPTTCTVSGLVASQAVAPVSPNVEDEVSSEGCRLEAEAVQKTTSTCWSAETRQLSGPRHLRV
eukprot:4378904-Amphidinium_carterae.1